MQRPFTILFVEDDSAVRDVVARMLLDHGFRVFTATNAYEALRIVNEHHVDVLFTDIVLPGLSGIRLAAQARLIRAGLKVLFSTGYAQKAADRDAMRQGKILLKPWRHADLIRELRTLLGSPA